jgi:hypothetical protein
VEVGSSFNPISSSTSINAGRGQDKHSTDRHRADETAVGVGAAVAAAPTDSMDRLTMENYMDHSHAHAHLVTLTVHKQSDLQPRPQYWTYSWSYFHTSVESVNNLSFMLEARRMIECSTHHMELLSHIGQYAIRCQCLPDVTLLGWTFEEAKVPKSVLAPWLKCKTFPPANMAADLIFAVTIAVPVHSPELGTLEKHLEGAVDVSFEKLMIEVYILNVVGGIAFVETGGGGVSEKHGVDGITRARCTEMMAAVSV